MKVELIIVIFSILLSKEMNGEEHLHIIKKIRDNDKTFDSDNYDIRFRTSVEKELDEKEKENLNNITDLDSNNIIFRYKQRISLIILDNPDITIRMDTTIVKTSMDINSLETAKEEYEVEIEVVKKKKSTTKYFDVFMKEIMLTKKKLQNCNHIMKNDEKEAVLSYYMNTIYGKESTYQRIYQMQSVSLEIQHVIDYIPNKYTITEKADGARYFLYILNNKVYLISPNKEIRFCGIESEGLSKYNNTLMDGEYMYIKKYNEFLFLAFDALVY